MSNGSGRAGPTDPAVVGWAVRPHGLAGEVVVEPADVSSAVSALGTAIWIAGRWREILTLRVDNKGRWVMRLDGVHDREAAEALRGAELVIESEDLPALDEGRYYVHELVGCRVQDTHGGDLGEVVRVVSGPQDWLEIENDEGRSLVPMVRSMLKQVDVRGRCIVIDPPQGLVEATRA